MVAPLSRATSARMTDTRQSVDGSTHWVTLASGWRERSTGLLVPSGDAAALTAALRRLVDEPETARAMGKEARGVALDRFDALSQSRRLEAKFIEMIQGL